MDFIQNTINWCNGEVFEGRMFALFGITVIVVSVLFWKIGSTPFSSAIFIPLLVAGLFCASIGTGMVISNNKRITVYQETFKSNPAEFVKSEKVRTEAFIRWYPYTMYITAGIIIIALCCYLFWGGAWGRAVGLGLLLLGLSVLLLDHFSEERAEIYHNHILEELKGK